jgi:hypothetical protein
MFTGMVPTLAREMFGYYFFFGGYEMCKIFLTPSGESKENLGLLERYEAQSPEGFCYRVVLDNNLTCLIATSHGLSDHVRHGVAYVRCIGI